MKNSKKIGQLPRPLGDMPAVCLDNEVYVLGGASGESVRDEVLRVGLDGRVEEVGRLPVALRGHQAVVVGDAVYVLGGFVEGTRAEVFRLDAKTFHATPMRAIPNETAWFTASVVGRKIYLVGGFTIPHGYWNEMACYDVDRDTWEVLGGAFPADVFPRARLGSNASVGVKGKILTFGGADEFDPERTRANALDVCAEYDVEKMQWRRLASPIEPREGLVAVEAGGFAYLVGGMGEKSEAPVALVERVDLTSGEVTPFGLLSSGRTNPSVATVKGVLLVAGGMTKPPFEASADIEVLDIP